MRGSNAKALLASLVVALLLLGCSADSDSPSSVVSQFCNHLKDHEPALASALLSEDTRAMLTLAGGATAVLAQMTREEFDAKHGGIEECETLDEIRTGGTATVLLRFSWRDGTVESEEFSVVQETGEWRIVFEK